MTSSKDLPPFASSYFPTIFLQSQFCSKPQWPPESTDLSGKTAIVTGSNTGLGLECAHQLLSFKLSRLIVAVRSVEKGEAAASKLRDQFPKATVEVWSLDMASYKSVQDLAGRVETELPRIDVVILNAGLNKKRFDLIPSTGHEEVIQVNYLSTMLLATLLLPVIKAKAQLGQPGRLSIVNSGLSLHAKFPNQQQIPLLASFDDQKITAFDQQERYSTSKLMGHMFMYKVADYVSPDDVIVNLVDPGFVKGTELSRQVTGIASAVVAGLKAATARTMKDGASTYLDAAVVKGKESHGCFLMNWEVRP
jgi:NAD(P)-dependent dehydrogenase (short-subunit alcohol dehydrogenase family)